LKGSGFHCSAAGSSRKKIKVMVERL
jgi:hypothetical protein